MGSAICLVVKFEIKAGCKERFIDIIEEHAKSTLASEPGCLRFEICNISKDDDRVFLFEMYRDAKAFEEHKASTILARTRKRYADLITAREIHISDRGRD
ncbi:putative quinol monooxygenase [Thioalkalivibrio sp. HK1]|uniref:putative quinol monooxygenase n=1 Tax=Thioalkalivibrio sp. HK1 TaxID=1469245 RepID=UPI000471A0EE|nr:antibiotic biosynthesis monooxygenase [Thioalkalivibrio sp. HK1]